ncbi:MAG: hypothetical protein ACOYT4_02880 [Nanoarchaeota archaeon]
MHYCLNSRIKIPAKWREIYHFDERRGIYEIYLKPNYKQEDCFKAIVIAEYLSQKGQPYTVENKQDAMNCWSTRTSQLDSMPIDKIKNQQLKKRIENIIHEVYLIRDERLKPKKFNSYSRKF